MEMENTKKRLIISPKKMSLKLSRYIQGGIDTFIAEEKANMKDTIARVEKERKALMSGSHDVKEIELYEYHKRDLLETGNAIAYAQEMKAALEDLCDKKHLLDF